MASFGRDDDYTPGQTFNVGDRVEIHPGCDLWIRGAKYGQVTSITTDDVHGTIYTVRMDRAGRIQRLQADRLRHVS